MKILAKIGIALSVLLILAGIIGMAVTFAGGRRFFEKDDSPVYRHGMIRFASAGNNIDKDTFCEAEDFQRNNFRHHMFGETDEYECNEYHEDHDDCPYEEETNIRSRYRTDDFEGCHRD